MDLINLPVAIKAPGQELTLTPMALLNFYLPGAREMENFPGVYEGMHPTKPGERVYIQAPVLVSALFEAQRKRLNPVSEIYVLPSTAPTKMATFKVKYQAAIDRLRKVPGFQGIDYGLILSRDKQEVRTIGYNHQPGDNITGAWAKLYLDGRAAPLEHEVSMTEARPKFGSPVWNDRPGFMIVKACLDHLLTRHYPVIAAEDDDNHEAIEVPSDQYQWSDGKQRQQGNPPPPQQAPISLKAGDLHTGTIARLKMREGKSPGAIELMVGEEKVVLWFFDTPASLRDVADAKVPAADMIGKQACFTFTERTDQKTKQVFRNVGEFEVQLDAEVIEEETLGDDHAG